MTIEELIIDDSFINFCLKKNSKDIVFWEEYLILNPSEKEKIEEAAFFVKELFNISKTVEIEPEVNGALINTSVQSRSKIISLFSRIGIRPFAVAAAVLLLFMLGYTTMYLLNLKKTEFGNGEVYSENRNKSIMEKGKQNETVSDTLTYATGYGEKKSIRLADSSVVILNSLSHLRIENNFAKNNRTVYIDGEALFDVTHNEKMPFIVKTQNFTVKVLGTKFNIKSYKNDKICEASLLRGKIELSVKNNTADSSIVLKPLQKVFISNEGISSTKILSGKRLAGKPGQIILNKETEVKLLETAWVYNRFEFEDTYLEDIAIMLERKFGVTIKFENELVKRYMYTASFEKESVGEILKALSATLPFKYEIKDKVIDIKK